MAKINWKNVVDQARIEALDYYQSYGTALTLRGLFYILVSKNIIPNTKNSYKSLSRVLSRERYKGNFKWYLLADTTRKYTYLERWEEEPRLVSEEELKKRIKEMVETSYSINPWEDQQYRVIAVLEKEALYDAFRRFLSEFPHGIYCLRCMKGFDSATDVKRIADMTTSISYKNQIPVLLVLSDFDPSGEEIYEDVAKRIRMLSQADIIVEKILVTKEQILKYNLPYTPESQEEIMKLQRDPRFKKFSNQHGLMRVELDAMVSLQPEETKKILINSVKKYFNNDVYETVTKKREEDLKKKAEDYTKKNIETLKKLINTGRWL